MRAFFRVVLGVVVVAIASLVSFSNSSALDNSWGAGEAKLLHRGERMQSASEASTCAGRMGHIELASEGRRTKACIFGVTGEHRMARYTDQGYYRYAFSPHGSLRFVTIHGICEQAMYCVYGQGADTLVAVQSVWFSGQKAVMIPHFSESLRLTGGLFPRYDYDSSTATHTLQSDTEVYKVRSVGVSTNGEWAVIEVIERGVVRVNLQTLQTLRVSTTNEQYGFGFNPSYELTISNSGSHVAVTGQNSGIYLFEISESCGESVDIPLQVSFRDDTFPCRQVSLNWHDVFPGFLVAQVPRFSPDANQLSLVVLTTSALYDAVLGPHEATPIETSGYSAFGDSFTSGEGETADEYYDPLTNSPTNRCHVSTRSYPFLVGEILQMSVKNYACSGYRSQEVIQRMKLATSGEQPAVVSISVGGNNVGFSDKLKTCLSVDTCHWVQPGNRQATALEIQQYSDELSKVLRQARQSFPASILFVVGYPQFINEDYFAECNPTISLMLNAEERLFVAESIKLMNDVIETTANEAGITYVDIEDAYMGQRICEQGGLSMNLLRFGDDFSPVASLPDLKFIASESFHPTPYGHMLTSERIAQYLYPGWESNGCNHCSSVATLSSYWNEQVDTDTPRIIQKAERFLKETDLHLYSQNFSVSIPAYSFEPGAQVSVELQSERHVVTAGVAAADGSFEMSGTLPAELNGYHSLHLRTTDAVGGGVDYYQVVYVDYGGDKREGATDKGDTQEGLYTETFTQLDRTISANQSEAPRGGATPIARRAGAVSSVAVLGAQADPNSSSPLLFQSPVAQKEVLGIASTGSSTGLYTQKAGIFTLAPLIMGLIAGAILIGLAILLAIIYSRRKRSSP